MALRRYRGKSIKKKGTPAVFRSNRDKVLRKGSKRKLNLKLKNRGSAGKKTKSKAKSKKGSGK